MLVKYLAMKEVRLFSFFLLFASCTTATKCTVAHKVLQDGIPFVSAQKSSTRLDLYTTSPVEYSAWNMFADMFLTVNLTDPDSYILYQGSNCSEVVDKHSSDIGLFGFLPTPNFWKRHQFYPFNSTAIGISTKLPYEITVTTTKLSVIRIATFVCGLLLFILASGLVRNALFYYTSGCSFGLLASLLLVAFIVWRVAPKKTIGIPILLGGWSVSLYMLHFAWSNFTSLMLQYQNWVAAYFGLALLISFAICYKKGPPTDARSHDIAQWTLQLIAIALVYVSCQISEVSLAVISSLVLREVSKSWIWGVAGFFGRMFGWILFWRKPQAPRLISEEEYEKQARETTRVELDRLRSYCQSPLTDAWKLARLVKNPQRLARFVEGAENHISDDEEQEHMHSGEILNRYSYVDDRNREVDDGWDEEIIIQRTPRDGKGRTIQIPLSARHLESMLSRDSFGSGSSLRVQTLNRQSRSTLPPGFTIPVRKSVSDSGPRSTPVAARQHGGGSPHSKSRPFERQLNYSTKLQSNKSKMSRYLNEYYSSDSETEVQTNDVALENGDSEY